MQDAVFWTLVALSAAKYVIVSWTSRRRRTQRLPAGRVSRLIIYPVKSMKGADVTEVHCQHAGLVGADGLQDRTWMVTTATYSFVTGRQEPKLTTIVPTVDDRRLQLDGPGMKTIKVATDVDATDNQVVQTTVWGEEIEAVDCGDKVADWISSCLGHSDRKYRLVYHRPDLAKRSCDRGPTRWHKTAKPDDKVAFQDGFPFMLMSESSVDELNQRLIPSHQPVTMDHFRPNIVVTDTCAFDEDDWEAIYIGDAVFTNIKPCQRCVFTTVDPVKKEKSTDWQPLETLRSYRLLDPEFGQSPCFGINLVLTRQGTVRVGDEVQVTRK